MQSLYKVVAASIAQEHRVEVLAHNLANASTIGFKADIPRFEVVASPSTPLVPAIAAVPPLAPFAPTPPVEEVYTTFVGVTTDMSPGELRSTGNPLDVAINGKGWFAIETPQGIRYTRKGTFTLNSQGQLVTQDGAPVSGNNGPITLEGGDIRIDPRGIVAVDGQEIDQMKIVEAPDTAFEKAESSLFALKPGVAAPEPAAEPEVKQGFLELSNVNTIKMMTELIGAMRAYESYQKVLQTIGETSGRIINDVGRLS